MTDRKSDPKQETATYGEMPRDNMGGSAMGRGMNENESERAIPYLPMPSRSIVKSSDIALRHHDSNLSVDWKTAPDGYQVAICKGNCEIVSVKSENPPATFPTQSLPAGEYWVKVKVSNKEKSEEEQDTTKHIEGSPSIVKLETPTNISLFFKNKTELKVTWDKVKGAESYKVEIVQVIEQAENEGNKIEFSLDSLRKPATIGYQAWVQAKGDEQHIDSNIGKSLTLLDASLTEDTLPPTQDEDTLPPTQDEDTLPPTQDEDTPKEDEVPEKEKLSKPSILSQDYDEKSKKITVKWEKVTNANGYLVKLVKPDENNQEVDSKQLNSRQKSAAFEADRSMSFAGDYQIWVQARGKNNYLDSDFSESKTLHIPAPPETETETETETSLSAVQLNSDTKDYIEIPSYPGLTGSNSRTIEAWIKTTSSNNQAIVSWGKKQAGKKWTFRVHSTNENDNPIRVEIEGGYIVGNTAVNDGAWHHVACTLNDLDENNVTSVKRTTDVTLYVDGKRQLISASQEKEIKTAKGRNVFIGNDFGDLYFNGFIDEVRIWNTERTQKQINDYKDKRLKGNESGLEGYWRFEEGVAKDYSGKERDGTYQGKHKLFDPSPLKSIPLKALEFDGKNDYVELPAMNLKLSKGFTIEAWVYYDRFLSWSRIIDFGNGASQDNIVLANEKTSSTLLLKIRQAAEELVNMKVDDALQTNQWMHIAATVDSKGNAKLYKNGEQIASQSFEPLKNVERTLNYIGKSNSSQNSYFDGKMDEVRLWSTARTEQEINDNMNQRLIGGESGLEAYWRFEEGIAKDDSGKHRDGTYQGKPKLVDPSPLNSIPLQALEFDGKDDYVELPAMNLQLSGGFTIEAWVYYDRFLSWSRIIDFGNGASQDNILLANEKTSSTLLLKIRQAAEELVNMTVDDALQTKQWMHIAATVDSKGNAKLYKNGKEIASQSFEPLKNVERTLNYIGKSNVSEIAYFDGKMDEVRLWSSARTEKQIKANMNKRLKGNESGLEAYWRFEEGIAKDYSAKDRDGTYQGSPKLVAPSPLITPLLALEFDGKDDYVELPAMNLQLSGGFTIEAWVYYDRFLNWSRIIDFANGARKDNIVLANEQSSSTLVLKIRQAAEVVVDMTVDDALQTKQWMHIAATVDSKGNAKLYKNGKEIASQSFEPLKNVERTLNYIGKSNVSEIAYFDGKMDEVRLWSTARTEQEINNYKDKRLQQNEPGLEAYWRFEEGVAKDYSGNGHDGTYQGEPKRVVAAPLT